MNPADTEPPPTAEDATPGRPATDVAWLRQGLEALVERFPHMDAGVAGVAAPAGTGHDVDLVIVGSGYGAALTAREFAGSRVETADGIGRPLSICILERGAEYLQGAFPSRFADLAGHVRFSTPGRTAPRGRPLGLFDLRLGGDVSVLLANGVGGGSLINAGVMLRPADDVMDASPWPSALRADPLRACDYDTVSGWLGAGTAAAPNTVAGTASAGLDKTAALGRIDGAARPVPLTVALRPGTRTVAGVPLSACVGCGDCATGCNQNAKISLDVGLLAQACHVPGVALHTGATVLRLERPPPPAGAPAEAETEPEPEGWVVIVQHTDAQLRLRQGRPFRLRARRVVLAAGALGSTEILLRSRRAGLPLSDLLGHRFSTNGDMLASVQGRDARVGAVADEDASAAAGTRRIGPTITAMIDRRDAPERCVIQDLAVPGALRHVFGETFATAATLHDLERCDGAPHRAAASDPQAVDPARLERMLPVALIGHDAADGRLELVPSAAGAGADVDREGDGGLRIDWPRLRDLAALGTQQEALERLARASPEIERVLPNPLWKALPDGMREDLGLPLGPLFTVHPLGGCAMGDSVIDGVVDHLGRVFDPAPGAAGATPGMPRLHEGLAVLDGAIVPTSLGVNPALTIATLAHRAARGLRRHWGISPPAEPAEPSEPPSRVRPMFRAPVSAAAPARPTAIELVERLRGMATFADGQARWIELTLNSRPTLLRDLMSPTGPRRVTLDAPRCQLRVYEIDPLAGDDDEPAPGRIVLRSGLAGHIDLFARAPSTGWQRVWRGLRAWLPNRGLRDLTQRLLTWLASPPAPAMPELPATSATSATAATSASPAVAGEAVPVRRTRRGWAWLRQQVGRIVALASRAGAVRRLDYDLTIEGATGPLALQLAGDLRFRGVKQLGYARDANPLTQLMELTLEDFPGLARDRRGRLARPRLALHLPYLASVGVPLLRVVDQQDQPTALLDLARFAAYTTRILVDGHLWSFRKPDDPTPRVPRRLPGEVPGAPVPRVVELVVARHVDAAGRTLPVLIRLTRYRPDVPAAGLPPVLLIHGYSASGTTFAHPTLEPGLMRHLTGEPARDVWILDLRSSCGLPATAGLPWAFEDMGYEDIPLAVDHVCRATGVERIDIVAHCMGSAMLMMGLLGDTTGGPARTARHEDLRRALWEGDPARRGAGTSPRGRIRRLVMSQVGPALLLAPANVARAYLMRYVKQFLAGRDYRFRPGPDDGLVDELLDRVLAALPYPAGEFGRENPAWPPGRRLPWVGTRHRIDALFGWVLNLAHMSEATLACIDDFFGPFNVDTVSQVMHFARYRLITDRHGFNRFVDPQRLRERLDFPMLSLHAPANGLVDAGSKALLDELLTRHCGPHGSFDSQLLTPETLGHQDSLIGDAEATRATLRQISGFLAQP